MAPKIALIGNPNVGKSTLFNYITGLKQRVGNYPGTTVEKRIAKIKVKGKDFTIYDFPGTYSLYPKSADEEIVFDVLSQPQHPDFPDKVVVIGSPSNLKRSLVLYQQVRDMGLPVIFALNMVDQAAAKNIKIQEKEIELFTGEKLIQTAARSGKGVDELLARFSRDFPVFQENYEIPANYAPAVQEIKEKLNLTRDYIAWQILAQGRNSFLAVQDFSFLKTLQEKHKIISARLQVKETIDRNELLDPIVNKSIISPKSDKPDLNEKLDQIFTHPVLGYIIFFGILILAFQAIYSWAELPMNYIDGLFAFFQNEIGTLLGDSPLAQLISNGLIPGIGGVVIFIPQIFILILFLLILEESGYMSRVVFLMDKWMKPFGLSGKSVVPLMSGAACAIPGIMAARNIENTKERLITILVTPFMTCSARLPIYAILIALVIPKTKIGFFNLQGLVLMGLYLLGIIAALLFAFVLKKRISSPYKSYLVMEMPDYKIPHWKNIWLGLIEKVSAFVFGAGKIILSVSILLWAMGSWGFSETYQNAEQIVEVQATQNAWNETEKEHHLESLKLEHSLLGNIGHFIEPFFKPLGYDWKISIGVLSSFTAREVFVGTMATIYSLGSETEDENTIIQRMKAEKRPDGTPVFSLATGVSLMVFYAFAMQCLSTLAIVQRETRTWKWPLTQFVMMSSFAYLMAYLSYQFFS